MLEAGKESERCEGLHSGLVCDITFDKGSYGAVDSFTSSVSKPYDVGYTLGKTPPDDADDKLLLYVAVISHGFRYYKKHENNFNELVRSGIGCQYIAGSRLARWLMMHAAVYDLF